MRNLASVCLAVLLVAACGDDGDNGGSTLPDGPVAIDAVDPCAACGTGETCVQRFDGTCTVSFICVATTLACAPDTCSAACEEALCATPYQCENRPPCGAEVAGVFKCYGP